MSTITELTQSDGKTVGSSDFSRSHDLMVRLASNAAANMQQHIVTNEQQSVAQACIVAYAGQGNVLSR